MLPAAAVVCAAASVAAQTASLSGRIAAVREGTVQVLFPARPDVCGDGQSYVRTARGRGNAIVSGDWSMRDDRPCVFGQGRILATVIDGEVTRLDV